MDTATIELNEMRAGAAQACSLMKVLSNPDRLLILCQLSQGEKRVGELEALLGIVQPTLSQQLTVLRDQQLVSTRREGKHIHYALGSPKALAVIKTLYEQFCGKGCSPTSPLATGRTGQRA
jgi:DNA-binding transcriptional ArsR family regulator